MGSKASIITKEGEPIGFKVNGKAFCIEEESGSAEAQVKQLLDKPDHLLFDRSLRNICEYLVNEYPHWNDYDKSLLKLVGNSISKRTAETRILNSLNSAAMHGARNTPTSQANYP